MKGLIRLYPRGWRERYGEEFSELIEAMAGRRSRLLLAWDIGRSALDAHLFGRYGMRRLSADPALRRGIYDGLIIAAFSAVVIVLTNVVFPPGPDESDSDPEYLVQYLILLAVLALLLVAVGARGRRRGHGPTAGARAAAAAGALLAALVTLTFIVVNNLFLGTVSQQHDKRVAFAASGWSSMRAYLTVTQLQGAIVLIPALTVVGGLLGIIGAWVFRPKATATPS